MSRTVTLRIKRRFFDEILAGTKLIEYRDAKAFYHQLFASEKGRVSRLRLHYQQRRTLEATVDSINLVSAPDTYLKTTGLAFGTQVYAIVLRNAQLV